MALNIEKKVEELIKPIIESIGYELYDVEYAKEGKEYYLRIFIDKEDGISIDDCETVNNSINDILDQADYIKEQYYLEVSSTGLEKNLRREEHFLKQIGNEIEVKLYKAINKEKVISGKLLSFEEEKIILETEEEKIEIEKSNISVAKTIYNW